MSKSKNKMCYPRKNKNGEIIYRSSHREFFGKSQGSELGVA